MGEYISTPMKALFLVLDTVRRDFLTPYGNSWVQTPNLTRLARQGVVFDNHWVGSLPCDGGPLYAYTAIPNHSLNRLHPRDGYSEWEMGRYFGHTYNMPLYKIPSKGSAPLELPGEESYVARHQLWDVIADREQNSPLQDPELEKALCERIRFHLHAHGAPQEQFERLGLEP